MFGRAKELEAQIDQFLDNATKGGLIFKSALSLYFDKGPCDEFEAYVKRILELEQSSDRLCRNIETKLYRHTLIPELRGDVLSLLEHIDDIINTYAANMFRFSIQTPKIPKDYRHGYTQLSDTTILCVESLILACRAFFRDIESVRDHVTKVTFYESEADELSTKVQREIFASGLGLARKRHLAYFIEHIDEVANTAEDIGDNLLILVIKRKI